MSSVGTGVVNRASRKWTHDFLRLDPLSFTGPDPNEDPQDFID